MQPELDYTGLSLPDRFVNSATAAKAWTKVLSKQYSIKEYANYIKKVFSSIRISKKNFAHMEYISVLITALDTDLKRKMLYPLMDDESGIADNLILEAQAEKHLLKLANDFIGVNEDQFDRIKEIFTEIHKEAAAVFLKFSTEESYNSIPYDVKDIADFCLYFIFLKMDDPFVVKDVLDAHPWVKNRMTKFYNDIENVIASGTIRRPTYNERALEYWQRSLNLMSRKLDSTQTLDINVALGLYETSSLVYADDTFNLNRVVKECIQGFLNEPKELYGVVSETLSEAEIDLLADELAPLKEITSTIEEIDISSIRITLNDNSKYIISEAIDERAAAIHESGFTETYMEVRIQEYRDAQKELSYAASNPKNLDSIPKLTENLKGKIEALKKELSVTVNAICNCTWIIVEMVDELQEIQSDKNGKEPTVSFDGPEDEVIAFLRKFPLFLRMEKKMEEARNSLHASEKQQLSLKEQNEMLSNHLNESKQIIAELKQNVHLYRAAKNAMRSTVEQKTGLGLDDVAPLLSVLRHASASPEEILRAYATLFPDRVIVLPSAYSSAAEAENFEMPERLAAMLESLIINYLDAIRGGKPDAEARHELGSCYAAKESDTVMKSSKLRAMRQFEYNGDRVTFTQHLRLGNSSGTQYGLRVYFMIDEGRVVIAYCGQHLDNASTS